ncbi:MAG: hypothetical protein IH989_08560 [Planctomycetes bacterium]|nr:hypothetical protein [Planctomycetota bacterium]
MNHILQGVYGEDLFRERGPSWKRARGGLMRDSGRELWENRSVDDWITLAGQYAFTDVVTWNDWMLDLPIVARSRKWILYHVPPQGRRFGGAPGSVVVSSTPETTCR